MSNRILITATAVFGLVLTGCDKEPENAAIEPAQGELLEPADPVEPIAPVEPAEPVAEAGVPQVLPGVAVIGVDIDCTATDVFFPTDSNALDAADKAALDWLAACLKGTPEKEQVEITARTDPRGPEPYNQKLSMERAKAVAEYLRQQGVKEGSFEIRARGEKNQVEGIPRLWPLQREATVEPQEPVTP